MTLERRELAQHTQEKSSEFYKMTSEVADMYVNEVGVEMPWFLEWIAYLVQMDLTQVKSKLSYDGYIYIYYLKLSTRFFICL